MGAAKIAYEESLKQEAEEVTVVNQIQISPSTPVQILEQTISGQTTA